MRRQRKKASMFAARKKTASKQSKSRIISEKNISDETRRIKTSQIASAAGASGKSKKNPKSKKTKKQHKFLKKLRTAILMIVFVGIVVSSGVAVGMYVAISREIKDMNVQNLELNYSSFIYYTDSLGNSHELEQLFDNANRVWLEPDEIPEIMKQAVVAIEDERFYKHGGVDIKRTFGAFIGWVGEKLGGSRASYGGSTITQQVIKNITHENDRSPIRKIKEMMRAIALEQELSKDEILTLYLNLVFFANNCYGVEAAANLYFDKSAIDLNLTEAAMIAGITQRPSYFDPLKNPENCLEKRNVVLGKMYELEMISEEEYNTAVESDLGLNENHAQQNTKIYSYFVDQVINDVINDLQTQKGYTETFAQQQVYNGGLKIYTTMDYDIQEKIESIFEDTSNFPSSSAARSAQAAMIIIDPYTGEIKGLVGGKGEKTDSRGLIRATQTRRQPGSSFKPLSVYAPSIELKKITAATILDDEKITIGDWSPQNSYDGYKGAISLRRAIEISSNTTAVTTLQDLGIDTSFNFLENKFHFTTLEDADKALSPLALGGLTYGVTLKELAAAYAVFANSGNYIKPYTYTKVIDNTGSLLLENNPEPENAISAETSYIITDLLTSVVEGSSGTGRLARLEDMPVAGKTGTTNDDYDKWFVGYTPYYVGAVWYGFDTPSSIYDAGVRNNISAQLWGKVMELVHEDLSSKEFSKPSTVVEAEICTRTGKLASSDCSYGSVEYFISGTEPTSYCGRSHSSSSSSSRSGRSGSSRRPQSGGSSSTSSPDDENNNDNSTQAPVQTPSQASEAPGTTEPTREPTAPPAASSGTSGNSPSDDEVIQIPDSGDIIIPE